MLCGNYPRAISQEVPMNLIHNICSEITLLTTSPRGKLGNDFGIYAFAEQILFKIFDKILYKLSELTHGIKIGYQGFRLWVVAQ